MSIRAGIYTRISQDRRGDELGVTRQLRDCQAVADREGWEVAEVYTDDDTSAYSGKPRKAYEQLLGDLTDGHVDAVIAWHPDRLHRDTRELEDFIDVVEAARAEVRTVAAGHYDLSSPSGRMTARVLGAVARHEGELKSQRASRKMQELAEAGAYTGGSRTFGYTVEFQQIPEEADAIREGAKLLLAGESLSAVARRWNEQGIATVRGREWGSTGVKRTMTLPRIAGLKAYKGEELGEGDWEPIIDRETRERLVARLIHHGRVRRKSRSRLLSGFLECGRCGHNMIGGRRSNGDYDYRCPKRPGYAGCGRMAIVSTQTDAEVRDRVVAVLSGDGMASAIRAAAGDDARAASLTDQLQRDEDALARLTDDHYVQGLLGRAEFLSARERLQDRITDTRRKLANASDGGVLAALPLADGKLAEAWDAADLSWQRAVLAAVVDRVTIRPAAYRGARWNPDRIQVDWRY